jgi:hypothetical protein
LKTASVFHVTNLTPGSECNDPTASLSLADGISKNRNLSSDDIGRKSASHHDVAVVQVDPLKANFETRKSLYRLKG